MSFSQLCLNNRVRKNIQEALSKSEMAAGALTNQIASKQSDKNCSHSSLLILNFSYNYLGNYKPC